MVRKNSMAMVAKMRGVTSLRIGSTPRARMASICSVTTMEPSSLAIEEAVPARDHDPGEHRAEFADHGQADELPGNRRRAERRERGRRLQRQHAAGRKPGEHNNRQRTDADDVGLNEKIRPVDRRAEEIR